MGGRRRTGGSVAGGDRKAARTETSKCAARLGTACERILLVGWALGSCKIGRHPARRRLVGIGLCGPCVYGPHFRMI
jgi:hypothetical protein